MKRAQIKPIPGTSFAENKDQARQLRRDIIIPALSAGDSVVIDFSEVETTTQSFVHALISEAIRRHGEEAIPRIVFKGCTGQVQQLITTVVEYTLMAADAAAELEDEKPAEGATDADSPSSSA
jgi:hypothetical protein